MLIKVFTIIIIQIIQKYLEKIFFQGKSPNNTLEKESTKIKNKY